MITTIRDGLVFELNDMVNLKDTSGQGNVITNNGTTLTTDEKNRPRRARVFNRSESDYLGDNNGLTNFTGTTPFTISSYIYRTSNTGYQHIWAKGNPASSDYKFIMLQADTSDLFNFIIYSGVATTRIGLTSLTLPSTPLTKTLIALAVVPPS